MKIGLYANTSNARAVSVCEKVSAAAAKLGLTVVTQLNTADAVVCLGGDGTILRAVHEFPLMPLLGFNLGGLGYLATVEERYFLPALRMLAKGLYTISPRTMLSAGKRNKEFSALNDIAVLPEQSGHAVVLDVVSDGRAVTRYMADGLVIATPTGSTAYSLAAGGPVLMPDAGVVVVTPLNPHALGSRPVVMRDTVRLEVTLRAREGRKAGRVGVYCDGVKRFDLSEDESAHFRLASLTARFIELDGYDPYETLAKKLGWTGSTIPTSEPAAKRRRARPHL